MTDTTSRPMSGEKILATPVPDRPNIRPPQNNGEVVTVCYTSVSFSVTRPYMYTVSDREFLVAGSRHQNSFPRDVALAPTLDVFWNHRKTCFFPVHFLHVFIFSSYVTCSSLAVLYMPL